MKLATTSRQQRPQAQQKVGNYILGDKIGVGGFGVVLRAKHAETGLEVAVKVLDKAQLQLMQMTSQIKREITLLTTLKHPNIVNGFEILNSPAKIYMVMELVEGGDMHTLVSKRRRIPEREAQRYFAGLMKCLHYCHERGVTHRDLKLENLLVTSDGELKVCDFGFASVRALNSDGSDLCRTVVGTEDFAAPEILLQEPYKGDKADMWSAGIVLYTMIAGYCPFRGEDTAQLFEAIKSCSFTFPEHISSSARGVVNSLLVADPENRCSAGEILEMEWLQNASNSTPSGGSTLLDARRCDTAQVPDTEFGSLDRDVSLVSDSSSPPMGKICSIKESYQEDKVSTSNLRKRIQESPSLSLAAQTIYNFAELYGAMRQNKYLVKDRRWRLRTFADVFVGEEMVSWIASHCTVSRSEAVDIGERLLHAEVFHHVCREHSFKDEYLFYRFAEDSPDSSVLNVRQFWPASVPPRDPYLVSIHVLNSLLGLLKLHQAIDCSVVEEFQEIDVVQLRQDDSFFAFRMGIAELQAVNLTLLADEEEKIAFLTNIYHVLALHIRIIGQQASQGRAHYKTRNNFQYNVAGVRLRLGDMEELLGAGVAVPGGSDYSSSRTSSVLSSSPRAVFPSTGELDISKKPSSLSTSLQSTASYLGFLLRRPDPGALAALRLEPRKKYLLPLFLSDGSPTDVPLRVFQKKDVAAGTLRVELVLFLITAMRIDNRLCSITIPNILTVFRKITGALGDREFLLNLAELFESALDENRKVDVIPDRARVAVEKTAKELRGLLTVPISVKISVEARDDEHFAPRFRDTMIHRLSNPRG